MSSTAHPALRFVHPLRQAARASAQAAALYEAARANRDRLIAEALLAGMSLRQVAQLTDVSYERVRKISAAHGVKLKTGPKTTR